MDGFRENRVHRFLCSVVIGLTVKSDWGCYPFLAVDVQFISVWSGDHSHFVTRLYRLPLDLVTYVLVLSS